MSLLAGAKLFDEGRFFEAHEAWEEHWLVEKDETRKRVLQGLIQIAAALHKLFVMKRADSAERLLAKGLAKLEASPLTTAQTEALDLAAFCDGIRTFARELEARRLDGATVPKLQG